MSLLILLLDLFIGLRKWHTLAVLNVSIPKVLLVWPCLTKGHASRSHFAAQLHSVCPIRSSRRHTCNYLYVTTVTDVIAVTTNSFQHLDANRGFRLDVTRYTEWYKDLMTVSKKLIWQFEQIHLFLFLFLLHFVCFFIRCEIKIFGMPGYLRPHRQAFTPLCRVKSYEGRIIQTQSRKMMHAQTKFQPRPGLRYPASLKVKRYTLFRRSVP